MFKYLKKSLITSSAISTLVFAVVPEAFFKAFHCIPDGVFRNNPFLESIHAEIEIIVARILTFTLILAVVAIIYTAYLSLRKRVTIKGTNYQISVEYGDLFKQENCKKVISFDECFSTSIGDLPSEVKESSICGQYLKMNPTPDIKSLIEKADLSPAKGKTRFQSRERYESGKVLPNGEYLLLAFARLDKDGLGRFFARDEYLECLSVLWKELDKYYGQEDVCIPILGSGLTRFEESSGASIPQQELLNIIIQSYILSSHKIKTPNKLRIICKKCEGFSINSIHAFV